MIALQPVEWRAVIGESLYQVSSDGRVRSNTRLAKGRELKPAMSNGYLAVKLGRRTWRIHQLVAHAFLGEQPKGYHVNHIDGDRLNNRVTNLEYVTAADNVRDMFRNGRGCKNRAKHVGPKHSRYRGVSRTAWGTWRAFIVADGKQLHLGCFKDEVDAAKAHDAAARAHHKEFAVTNFPHS